VGDGEPGAPVQAPDAIAGESVEPGPQSVPTQPEPSEAPIRQETEWTWMEAAAASWLARREAEEDRGGPAHAAPPAPATTGDAGETPRRP
jgi:hypothetical protein